MRIYPKGARVSQANYGSGTVCDANDRHTLIDFDNHGLRKFSTEMVVLGPTDEPAPERAKSTRRSKTPATSR